MTSLASESSVMAAFAEEVGAADPVCVAGGRTQWSIGGLPAPGTREVVAPAGVVSHQPAEMIVRVRAGTVVGELSSALAEGGQMVPLDPSDPDRATVGGVLAVGHSGVRRLRYGPVRDCVLEVRFVTADGRMVKAGGPVVKNVTGFDLCRLLVGSLGTLGLLAEVVMRCYPLPAVSLWYSGRVADPADLFRRLYRPSSVLWDGEQVWVLLEGHPADVADQAGSVLGSSFSETDGPPPLPAEPDSRRLSVAPTLLSRLGLLHPAGGSDRAHRVGGLDPADPVGPAGPAGPVGGLDYANHPEDPNSLFKPPTGQPGRAESPGGQPGRWVAESPTGQPGRWVAEFGVGVVHAERPAEVAAVLGLKWPPALSPAEAALNGAVKARFDPDGRLNPGRKMPA